VDESLRGLWYTSYIMTSRRGLANAVWQGHKDGTVAGHV